jgi:hypothetical protein
MNLSFCFIFLLALSDLLQASPIPQNSDPAPPTPQKKWITWRTWVPLAGAAAFLGGLATFVYLGTNSEESYKSTKSIQLDQKLSTLSPEEQNYLRERHIYLGKKTEELGPREIYWIQTEDERFGFRGMNLPDLKGVDKKTRKEVMTAYGKLHKAMHEVRMTEVEKAEMRNKKENARILTLNAQREAAVIIATDLKKAWEKAAPPEPPAPPERVESQ